MAIFYIMDHDQDGSLRYKMGDIVECRDIGPNGVTRPMPPPFRIVNVTNISAAQVMQWMAAHEDANGQLITRRQYMLDVSKMTTQQRDAFLNNRYIETTVNAARKWIKNKLTGTYEG